MSACLQNPLTKLAGGVAQGVDPEFKPQYYKTKKMMCQKFRVLYYHNGKNIQIGMSEGRES
jgi:hypothetical protein